MSKPPHSKRADTGKTKQQLIDELDTVRREATLLAGIISIAADAIVSVDDDQRITRFNQGAEHIFGYSAGDIIGEPLEILLPDQFRRSHRQHVQNFGRSPSTSRLMNTRGPIQGLKKDGTPFPARASISQFEHDGRTILTVYLRDLSELTRAQEVAEQTREELAHVTRVGMLGEISASLAHEVNQPLGAIRNFSQATRNVLVAE
jgi:PAS domain S-box-containing protein